MFLSGLHIQKAVAEELERLDHFVGRLCTRCDYTTGISFETLLVHFSHSPSVLGLLAASNPSAFFSFDGHLQSLLNFRPQWLIDQIS
jgi:hypothetical protein